MSKYDLGKVHVYTGNGKGKTTASLGLAVRAIGQGYKVAMVQFLKSEYTGEKSIAGKIPGLDIFVYGSKCKNDEQHKKDFKDGEFKGFCSHCFKTENDDETHAKSAFEHAAKLAEKGEHNILILDEINVALSKGLVSIEQIDELIKNKDKKMELVMTGRNATRELMERADLVTEMREIKHYMTNGVPARKGVEF